MSLNDKPAKPLFAWALKTNGSLSILDLSESREDALAYQNRAAGQKVVQVKITEIRARS